ncbi:YifB family Mg chelatase-like AAA ATPase [Micromonospora aurantiaca (nom. illeg.)]|uniref:YifB family Mg chelatase-like AAA ATPase n=1 Tax=Micromonospora aurantiaca (nom. illeg.) TaxID=47850 RepID=UPI0001BF295A|nr:YifB family Mg chelatase-like AAA ATPase [Micromonospora aurantiaca]ADL44964.1 Mg chelatase, subunit ChlI [Micromonospora aurantiaca ATCC 27029]
MGYAKVLSVGLAGVAGHLVEVEADLAPGLPAVIISGLPDTALHEARDRVRAAIVNSGQKWPNRRITLNLLPATLPKYGSAFDLAIALAVLAGSGELPPVALDATVVLGELGLDGAVRPVRGTLPMVAAAARAGHTRVVVPAGNAAEAAVIPGVRVHAVDTLHRLVAHVRDGSPLLAPPAHVPACGPAGPDLVDVAGQPLGRRALEIAAAGGHHLALFGPPGAGKTMLAERLPSILPQLDDEAALEVTALHSIAGLLPPGGGLLRRPPFQAPHHTATVPALVGGGSGLARPGAVSLAHRGVLFLDEAPEFSKGALEALRQPLESGRVRVARTRGATEYPARTQLVLAANPCPCAKPSGDVDCECPPLARRRYLGRLSGPLLDRVDVQVRLTAVRAAELLSTDAAQEFSATVAARVVAARHAATDRWAATGHRVNADVPGPYLRRPPWHLPARVTTDLRRRLDTGSLSARGYDRVLRLAWTIADLDGRDRPGHDDVAEAIQLRTGEVA